MNALRWIARSVGEQFGVIARIRYDDLADDVHIVFYMPNDRIAAVSFGCMRLEPRGWMLEIAEIVNKALREVGVGPALPR